EGPQQPVGAPGIQNWQSRGREERDHAVGHTHIHRHDEQPQAQLRGQVDDAVITQRQANSGGQHRQHTQCTGHGDQAGMQLVTRPAEPNQAHETPGQYAPAA
ncbi:hypothetical protein CSC81_18495, partial [Tenacibaculum discolor]